MIYFGDCMDLLSTMDSHSVDLVIQDPPYDIPSSMGGGVLR